MDSFPILEALAYGVLPRGATPIQELRWYEAKREARALLASVHSLVIRSRA